MFTDILWRFLILETFVLEALCELSCPYVHRQKRYCTSDLVLKMAIVEVINVTKGHRYRMASLHSFRGLPYTLNYTRYLHVYLETETRLFGTTSLVFGQNINGTLYSDNCTSNMPWYLVDLTYWRNLLIYYKTGCHCTDEIGEYRYESCRSIYSYMKPEGGICRWQTTPDYKECRRNGRRGK